MTGKMNWSDMKKRASKSLSIKDEKEYRKEDRAQRWLDKADKSKHGKGPRPNQTPTRGR